MGAVARASHPALYDGDFHPTAVCGGVGAAVAAARLLELGAEQSDSAMAIALHRRGRACARPSARTASRCRWGSRRRPACARPGWRRPVRACRSTRAARGFADATGGAYARPDARRARDRRELDQGLALLPADPRCDRGRRRRWARPRAARRDRASGVAPGGRLRPAPGRRPAGEVLDSLPAPPGRCCTGRRGWTSFESSGQPRSASWPSASRCGPTARCSSRSACSSAEGRELARVKAALGSPGQPMDADERWPPR